MKNLNFGRNDILPFVKNVIGKESINAVEVGVFRGHYTMSYFHHLKNSKLYLVDLWETSTHDGYISGIDPGDVEKGYSEVIRTFGSQENVSICKGFSSDWANQFEDEFFDWIYLDADHSKKAVLNDLTLWYPKLKKGGAISGHDFLPNPNDVIDYFGVDEAVKEFFKDNLDDIYLTAEPHYKSWLYFKPKV